MGMIFRYGVLPIAAAAILLSACTSGGVEDQFAKALSDLNNDWELYEIAESRGSKVIKVEVMEIVSFKDAKKAVEAIQKVDPKFAGYLDFYDAKTGTVVRKMEIIPSST